MKNKPTEPEDDKQFPGYPHYPGKDDIYEREKEESLEEEGPDLSEGLDVPGADLDDENEIIGEEDEENNFYSLGGDEHNDLEEAEDGE